MELTVNFGEYTPWSGAVSTFDLIEEAGKLEELEELLEEMLGEVASMVAVNDLLWFDGDEILDRLGIMSDAERERISDHIYDSIVSLQEELKELYQDKAELEADEDTDGANKVSATIEELEAEVEYLKVINKDDDEELEDYRESFMD